MSSTKTETETETGGGDTSKGDAAKGAAVGADAAAGVFVDASGNVHDILTFLGTHLRAPFATTTASCYPEGAPVLESALARYGMLDARLRTRILLSLVALPKAVAERVEEAASAFVAKAREDTTDWVRVTAEIVANTVHTRRLDVQALPLRIPEFAAAVESVEAACAALTPDAPRISRLDSAFLDASLVDPPSRIPHCSLNLDALGGVSFLRDNKPEETTELMRTLMEPAKKKKKAPRPAAQPPSDKKLKAKLEQLRGSAAKPKREVRVLGIDEAKVLREEHQRMRRKRKRNRGEKPPPSDNTKKRKVGGSDNAEAKPTGAAVADTHPPTPADATSQTQDSAEVAAAGDAAQAMAMMAGPEQAPDIPKDLPTELTPLSDAVVAEMRTAMGAKMAQVPTKLWVDIYRFMAGVFPPEIPEKPVRHVLLSRSVTDDKQYVVQTGLKLDYASQKWAVVERRRRITQAAPNTAPNTAPGAAPGAAQRPQE